MAPGALQQRQMISSLSTKSQLGFTFHANENRAGLPSGDEFGNINHQPTLADPSPVSGELPPRVIKTHALIRTEHYLLNTNFDDLDRIRDSMHLRDVENAVNKYSLYVESAVKGLVAGKFADAQGPNLLNKLSETPILQRQTIGGMPRPNESRLRSLYYGLIKVKHVVHAYRRQEQSTVVQSKVSTGLLGNLFKHSEIMCSDVIKLGGLDVLLNKFRNQDTETLKHCASALANLSLYGGPESHDKMIKRKVPTWLFCTLVFNTDVNIKYYAFLAIFVLVYDKEDEDLGAAMKSRSLDMNNPLVITPTEFDKSNMASHSRGQSLKWLKTLVPVLSSTREEACNLAAFNFCMEAGINKQLGMTSIFRAIDVIKPLKKMTSCENIIA
ncbi:hypothetical protein ACI65C_001846 [Semiaphis heraclei]